MKIGLIDVDSHNYPNLALMKISAYHKANGDDVEWWWGFGQYDRVYMSKVFDETYSTDVPEPLNAKEHNSVPFLGLMASEGGQREMGLTKNGCNYFGKETVRSCPFAVFTRQDLLHLALDLDVPVPKIYGDIVRDPDGTLRTTRAQRTGCSMCGFGIHMEQRPHRFDRLREDNPKEWAFWMYRCVTDPETGEKYGWGRVLDYLGIEWENIPGEITSQVSMEGI